MGHEHFGLTSCKSEHPWNRKMCVTFFKPLQSFSLFPSVSLCEAAENPNWKTCRASHPWEIFLEVNKPCASMTPSSNSQSNWLLHIVTPQGDLKMDIWAEAETVKVIAISSFPYWGHQQLVSVAFYRHVLSRIDLTTKTLEWPFRAPFISTAWHSGLMLKTTALKKAVLLFYY